MTERRKDDHKELRQKAEHRIAQTNAAAEDLTGMSPQQIAGLVHELRVHQVELKMQNDELRRIQTELENARDRYLHLYDFAPTAYFTVDEMGAVAEANLTAATLLDRSRKALVGQMFSRFIHRDDQDIWYLHRKRLLETGNFQSPYVRLVKSDGAFFYVNLECMLAKGNGSERKDIRIAATDVTRLKHAEQALQHSNATLRESEEKFRALFEHSQVAVLLTIPDGTIEAANPAACAMFGFSEQEICAIGRSGILDESDPRFAVAFEERQRTGRMKAAELTAIRKGEERFPVEVDSVILPAPPVRAFLILRDITERKRAEEALQRRQEEFRALVENAPDVISLFDRNLRRIYVNAEVKENTGRDASFMIGQSLTEAGYPDSFAQPLNAALQNVFATGREETVELDWEAPKGHMWLQVRCAPIRTADGSIAQVMSIGRDITERKAVEKALRESEARLSAILNELPIGVGVFDMEGRATLKNDLMRHHVPDTLPSRDPDWRKRWHCEDSNGRPIPPDQWPGARALRGERVVPGMEFSFTDQGRTFWKMVSAVPFSIKDDHIGAIAVVQDITELKQAEAALRDTNQELNEYSYALTHNLKAPFRAIQNYASFLLEDLADTLEGEPRQFLDGIKKAVDQAHQQFGDLEALYQIKKYEVDFKPVDMRTFLGGIASMYPDDADRQLIIADQWPVLRTERFLLRQVLMALIDNGFKYNQSAEKRVEIGWQKANAKFKIFVRDNGIGIDPQHHRHIFLIFKRLHTSEEYKGTGIGLAIVKRSVKKIGGKLRIESTVGEGSTFVISLPTSMVESEPEA